MKKARFIDLVCARLSELGASESDVKKQRIHINSYLTGLGIGEESEELDYESPTDFADEIYSIIKDRTEGKNEPEEIVTENMESTDDTDDDVKVFVSGEQATEELSSEETAEPEEEIYESLGDELESEASDYYDEDTEEIGATREFDIKGITSSEEAVEEYEDEEDEECEEDELPIVGNPVFFVIISVLLSPVWLPVALLAALACVVLFVLLSVFIVVYIPLLVALILGGSVMTIAEVIYSIVKLVTGQVHIGLFELGIGAVLMALVIFLSVVIYRFGTKYAVKTWKNYLHGVGVLFKRLKRLVRKFRRVCSI